MPIPHSVARFNKRVTNRALTPVVTRLPGFVVILHTGRKTGRTYRAPVLSFQHDGDLVIALTYGPETEWVRNVLAHGGCSIDRRGDVVSMTAPRLVHDRSRSLVPVWVRLPLWILNAPDFLVLSPVTARPSL
jgi:deazaflavin-dependent oxidoreductase (nitroreductase family)